MSNDGSAGNKRKRKADDVTRALARVHTERANEERKWLEENIEPLVDAFLAFVARYPTADEVYFSEVSRTRSYRIDYRVPDRYVDRVKQILDHEYDICVDKVPSKSRSTGAQQYELVADVGRNATSAYKRLCKSLLAAQEDSGHGSADVRGGDGEGEGKAEAEGD